MVVGALVGGLPGLVVLYFLALNLYEIAAVGMALVAGGAVAGALWAGRRDARRHEVALP